MMTAVPEVMGVEGGVVIAVALLVVPFHSPFLDLAPPPSHSLLNSVGGVAAVAALALVLVLGVMHYKN